MSQLSSQTPTNQQQSLKKSQRLILDFNKTGLDSLSNLKTVAQSLDYFKKAQRAVLDQLKINPNHKKMNQLAAITFNNLACYYKKGNKPKVALSYLKKALQIEVFKVENWTSTASTHLNICAIYSFMKKHQQAAQHAMLANKMLQKVQGQQIKSDEKSYWNIKMLAHYNSAIQLQYLKKYQQGLKQFDLTIQIAQKLSNVALIKSCKQGKQRVQQADKSTKRRLIQILTKRKQNQIKGNSEFMRKNKKNVNFQSNEQWKSVLHNRKYIQYKVEPQLSKHRKYQSADKLVAIKPITMVSKQ